MANIAHVGDTGTVIIADLVEDVSNATTREILLQKPSTAGYELLTKTATVYETSDTKIKYPTEALDLDEPGEWKVEGHVITPDGEWWSVVGSFVVLNKLEDGVELV